MSKIQDIEDILATRDPDLLISVLWDDPAIKQLVRRVLMEVSAADILPYRDHFVGAVVRREGAVAKHVPVFVRGGATGVFVDQIHGRDRL